MRHWIANKPGLCSHAASQRCAEPLRSVNFFHAEFTRWRESTERRNVFGGDIGSWYCGDGSPRVGGFPCLRGKDEESGFAAFPRWASSARYPGRVSGTGRRQWGRHSLASFFGETKNEAAPPGAHPGLQARRRSNKKRRAPLHPSSSGAIATQRPQPALCCIAHIRA